jgi:hypothetical protein
LGEEKGKTSYGAQSVDYRKLGEDLVKAMEPADLNRFLIIAALVPDLYCPGYNPSEALAKDSKLAFTAVRYKVNAAKITAQMKEDLSSGKGKKQKKVNPIRAKTVN